MPFDWNQYWQNYLPQMRKKQAQYEAQNDEYQKKLNDLGQMSTYDALKAQFQALQEQNQDSVSGYQIAMQGFGLNEAPENNSFSFSSDDSSNQASGNDFSNFSTDFSNDNWQRPQFSWEKEDETGNIQTDNVNEQDTFHDSFAQETSPILTESQAGFTDNSVASTYSQNQKMSDSATKDAFWNRLGRSLMSQAYAAEPTSNAYIQASDNFVQPSEITSLSEEEEIASPKIDFKNNFVSQEQLAVEKELGKQIGDYLREMNINREKDVPYMYKDKNGDITVGRGFKILGATEEEKKKNVIKLPFFHKSDHLPASKEEILEDYDRINRQEVNNYGADYFNSISKLILLPEGIDKIFYQRADDFINILRRQIPNWDSMKPQTKGAALEASYIAGPVGVKSRFPRLHQAATEKNLQNFCKELHLDETNRSDLVPRNKEIYELCMKGGFN